MNIRAAHQALLQQTKNSVNHGLARAVAAHHGTLLVAGNIYDFTINDSKLIYVPQLLMQQLKAAGYCVIQYSKGRGGRIYQYSSYNSSPEKKNIDQRLRAVGLLPMLTQDQAQPADGEVTSFFRSMGRLLQVATSSGPPLALVLEYAEHQCPHEQGNQSESDENLVVAEILHSLANSPALRRSGNLVICFARNEYHSLLNDFHRIDYAFPSQAQTESLINYVKQKGRETQRSIYADLAKGFSNGELARLTQGMGLKDIESMFRDAQAQDQDLSRNAILEAKAASILRASEGTLSLVRTRDV